MQNLVKVSRIIVAAMFILSAISKLLSLPFFDGLVAELLIGADYYNHPDPLFYTQLLTRFLIAIELLLGVALLQDKWFKKLVLPSVMLMLLLFTVHLFYEGLTSDKGFVEGNCGCFGDILPMNNLESILKNVAAMLFGLFIWIKYKPKKEMMFAGWVGPAVLGIVTLLTLLLTVKSYDSDEETEQESEQVQVVDSTLYQQIDTSVTDDQAQDSALVEVKEPETTESSAIETVKTAPDVKPTTAEGKTLALLKTIPTLTDGSKINVKSGKTLVCMFSMTCGHCQDIYKDICSNSENPNWPKIVLVNFGKQFEQTYFFLQSGECNHAHVRTENYMKFNKWLEGEGFPRIIALDNGKIAKSWDIDSYSKEALFTYYGIVEKKKSDDPLKLKPKDDLEDIDEGNPWD